MQRIPGGRTFGAKASVTPAGRLHAVDPSTEQTLCGEEIARLHLFREMMWDGLHTGVRCRYCEAELAAG